MGWIISSDSNEGWRQLRECYLEAFKHTFGGKQSHKNSENPSWHRVKERSAIPAGRTFLEQMTIILTVLGDLPVMLIKSSRRFCKSWNTQPAPWDLAFISYVHLFLGGCEQVSLGPGLGEVRHLVPGIQATSISKAASGTGLQLAYEWFSKNDFVLVVVLALLGIKQDQEALELSKVSFSSTNHIADRLL